MTLLPKAVAYARLDPARRRAFWQALRWVVLVRLGLSTIRYARLASKLPKPSPSLPAASLEEARLVAWAVARASAIVPDASCLTQALAAQAMLARLGRLSAVRLGVAKDEGGALRAHAWLLTADMIVCGGPLDSGYTHLADLGPEAA